MVDRQYKSSGAPIVKGNQPRDTEGVLPRTYAVWTVQCNEIGRMLQITSDSCTVHVYYTANDNINPPIFFSLLLLFRKDL